jgi:hypothetical protein
VEELELVWVCCGSQTKLLFKNKIILVIILFIYSSFSVPPKEKEYPECATSARTWDVSAVVSSWNVMAHGDAVRSEGETRDRSG